MLVCIHPHGLYPVGLDFMFACNQEMARFKPVATSLLFQVPLMKECAGWSGAIPAERQVMVSALRAGHALVMAPAGVADVLEPRVLETRKGFIRVAMEANVPVVPVYSQGERALYDLWLPAPAWQRWFLRATRVPLGFFARGLWWLPIWPKRAPVVLHVGRALHPRDFASADDMHGAFIASITSLLVIDTTSEKM